MEETGVFTAAADARGVMALPTASTDTTLQERFAWLSASTSISARPPVSHGEQSAALTDELREWGQLAMAAALEGWPDDDWSDL